MTALRSLTQRAARNSVWLFVGRVISQGLAALTIILIARTLGPVGLGQYSFITSAVFLLNTLTTFGTDTLIIREVARRREDVQDWIAAALIIQFTLSAIITALISLLWGSIQSSETIVALCLYSLVLFPLCVSTV